MLLYGAICCLPILLTNCKKNNSTGPAITSNQNLLPASRVSPANPNNPYDNIGAMHNSGLDYFINNSISKSNFSNIWITMAGDFEEQNDLDSTGLHGFFNDSVYYALGGSQLTTTDPIDPQQEFNTLLSKNAISEIEYNYLNQMYAAVDSNLVTKNTDSSISAICGRIITIENDIQKNVTDPTAQKNLLVAAAVTRYSVAYWLNQAANPKNPWNIPPNVHAEWSLIHKLVGDDLAGADAASVTWGIIAAVAAPGVGWGVSVLAGGIGASVGGAMQSFW